MCVCFMISVELSFLYLILKFFTRLVFFFQTDPLRLFVNIKQDLLFGSSEYIENLAFKLIFTKEDLRV